METEVKAPQDILARLEEVSEELNTEVQELDDEDVNFNSDVDDWSVKQIMAHLRDAERIYGQRIKRILSEEEPFLQAFNPDELAEERKYQEEVWAEVRDTFQEARTANIELFRTLNPAQWLKGGIHQERGRITIRDIAQSLISHSEEHLEQIRHVSWLAK